MTENDSPQPPEEPEREGIPDYAADTSTAYDESDRPRFEDSPPALPADEPQAVDEPAVTGPAARRGEPLSDHLAREEPDVSADRPAPAPEQPPGRLVEPDEGARGDTEQDLVASDQGEAGGGLTAEEAAMHEVDADEVPYQP